MTPADLVGELDAACELLLVRGWSWGIYWDTKITRVILERPGLELTLHWAQVQQPHRRCRWTLELCDQPPPREEPAEPTRAQLREGWIVLKRPWAGVLRTTRRACAPGELIEVVLQELRERDL